jgi:hypothetical protein
MEFVAYENWLTIRTIPFEICRGRRLRARPMRRKEAVHISIVTTGPLTMLWPGAGGVSGKDTRSTRKRKQSALMRQSLANLRSASNAIACFALVSSSLAFSACAGNLSFDADAGASTGGATGAGGSIGGGAGGGTGNVITSCANAMTVLASNCFDCHGSSPIYANLDLMSAGVETRLVGVAASVGAPMSMCAGKGNLLNHGTLPATGILIDKINNRQTCGGLMPYLAGMTIAAADIDCLQQWANGLVATVGP